jgi:hypothetical protein
MQDRLDQEFYRSEWHRALPLGPPTASDRTSALRIHRDCLTWVAWSRSWAPWPRARWRSGAGRRSAWPGRAAVGAWASPGAAAFPTAPRVRDVAPGCATSGGSAMPVQGGLAHGGLRRAGQVAPERTETIERARRHHGETYGDYVRVHTRLGRETFWTTWPSGIRGLKARLRWKTAHRGRSRCSAGCLRSASGQPCGAA